MQDNKALQSGTSHDLGQNCTRHSTQVQSEAGEIEYAWNTSWGVSTRIIGGLVIRTEMTKTSRATAARADRDRDRSDMAARKRNKGRGETAAHLSRRAPPAGNAVCRGCLRVHVR